MEIKLSISEKGFFLGGQRINMTENQFVDVRLKNDFFIWEGKPNPGSNCAICYRMDSPVVFFCEMDVWLTPDGSPLSDADFENIRKYYDSYNPQFNKETGRYKLRADISLPRISKGGTERHFAVPTGFDYVFYDCTFYKEKIGLRCFHLQSNYSRMESFLNRDDIAVNMRLLRAVTDGDFGKAESLITEGADVNFRNPCTMTSALENAAYNDSVEICGLLLKNGALMAVTNTWSERSPDVTNALCCACSSGGVRAGKFLIQNGAKYDIFGAIDDHDFLSCFPEIKPNYDTMLEFLLKCGVSPNDGKKSGVLTPLMYAAMRNYLSAAKLLIEYGADVNALTVHDGTALRVAVLCGHTEMAGLLIEHGADVNAMVGGMTCLDAAFSHENPDFEMIHLLAFCGGKINVDTGAAYLLKTPCFDAHLAVSSALVPVNFREDWEMILALLRCLVLLENSGKSLLFP